MADEQKQIPEDDLYNGLASIEPERDIALVDESNPSGDNHKTMKERIEESPNLSDMQTADRRLFPDMRRAHLNRAQVGRTFPDVYNPLYRINVKDAIKTDMTKLPEEQQTIGEILTDVNTALSISIDGEGRIDELGLAGVAHDEKLATEAGKGLT
jgi:hypothetical protein